MTDAEILPLHNRQACGRYVDLRLGFIDGVEHTKDSAYALVVKSHGAIAAKYAASLCDGGTVEYAIELRKARPDDFRKPTRNRRQ